MSAMPEESGPISRAEVEAKLREIRGEVDATAESAKGAVVAAAVVGAVVVIGLAYVLGRRRGKKKTTVVEVRRV